MVRPEPIPCPNCGMFYPPLQVTGYSYTCPTCGRNYQPKITEYPKENTMDDSLIKPKYIIAGCIAVILFLMLCVGGCAGLKSFNRYQKRADANNSVKVTHTLIRKAEQQAKIVAAQDATIKAKADQRAIEADGIRRAQDKISKTLTPLYVQHEAIKAMAESGATTVYIPAGEQGVPLVADINDVKVGK
jgi:predicted  nucleic acid-binding Zn-ribbon protein